MKLCVHVFVFSILATVELKCIICNFRELGRCIMHLIIQLKDNVGPHLVLYALEQSDL